MTHRRNGAFVRFALLPLVTLLTACASGILPADSEARSQVTATTAAAATNGSRPPMVTEGGEVDVPVAVVEGGEVGVPAVSTLSVGDLEECGHVAQDIGDHNERDGADSSTCVVLERVKHDTVAAPQWPFRGIVHLMDGPTQEGPSGSDARVYWKTLQYWDSDKDELTEILLGDARDLFAPCSGGVRMRIDSNGIEIANYFDQYHEKYGGGGGPVFWIPWGGRAVYRWTSSPDFESTFNYAVPPVKLGVHELRVERVPTDWFLISNGVQEHHYPIYYLRNPGEYVPPPRHEHGFGYHPRQLGADGEIYGILAETTGPGCSRDNPAWLTSASTGEIIACGTVASAMPRLLLPDSRNHEFDQLEIPEQAFGPSIKATCAEELDLSWLIDTPEEPTNPLALGIVLAPQWPFRGIVHLMDSPPQEGLSIYRGPMKLQYWDSDKEELTEVWLGDMKDPSDPYPFDPCYGEILVRIDSHGLEIAYHELGSKRGPVFWIPWGGRVEPRRAISPAFRSEYDPDEYVPPPLQYDGFDHPRWLGTDGETHGILAKKSCLPDDERDDKERNATTWLMSASSGEIIACGMAALAMPRLILPDSRQHEFEQLGEFEELEIPEPAVGAKVDQQCTEQLDLAWLKDAPTGSENPDMVRKVIELDTVAAPQWPFRGIVNLMDGVMQVGTLESGPRIYLKTLQYWDSDKKQLTEVLLGDVEDLFHPCAESAYMHVNSEGIEIVNRGDEWYGSPRSVVFWIPWGGHVEHRWEPKPEFEPTFSYEVPSLNLGARELQLERVSNDWFRISNGVREHHYPIYSSPRFDPGEYVPPPRPEHGFGHHPRLLGTDGEMYGILADTAEPACSPDNPAWLISASTGEIIACRIAVSAMPRLVLPDSRRHEFNQLEVPEEAFGRNLDLQCSEELDLADLADLVP